MDFLKKFQNLEIWESSGNRDSAANFRTLGELEKKVLRLKNAPKLADPLLLLIFNLQCQLSVYAEIFRIILSHKYLTSRKVSSKYKIGHVPTFEVLVPLTWNDPIIYYGDIYYFCYDYKHLPFSLSLTN